MHEGRRMRQGEGLQRRLVDRPARGAHHEGHRLHALDVVRHRDDGSLFHLRMPLEHRLDLTRENVLAARDEHVVDPTDDIMEAVGVAPHHVAGDVPAIRGDRRGEVGAVVVAVHQTGRPLLQHAVVAERAVPRAQPELHAGMRIADREQRRRLAGGMRAEHHRSRFRGAIGVDQPRSGEGAADSGGQRLANRG
jgi:hypothetical protein